VDATFDLLTLGLLPGVGPRAARDLRARGPLGELLARPAEHRDLLPEAARAQLRSGQGRREAEDELARAGRSGIRIVGCDEPCYPALLRRIYDPPPVLYTHGSLVEDAGTPSIAVVGSRAASPAGLALGAGIGRDLAAAGVTVVSGLARGIDSAAHRGALQAGGRTVAVLGSGLDRLYPPENASLARAIAAAGVVVSEFRLGTGPQRGHFPRRNRLIAGWSRAVVVVEAGEKSGALGTVRAALEEGRDVLAVPGHPSHPGAAGVNRLIRDGAPLVRNGADVLHELGLEPAAAVETSDGDALLEALDQDAPRSLEDLQARSGRPITELLRRLSALELDARVRRLPGALYVRA